MSFFTAGQKERMRFMLTVFRARIIQMSSEGGMQSTPIACIPGVGNENTEGACEAYLWPDEVNGFNVNHLLENNITICPRDVTIYFKYLLNSTITCTRITYCSQSSGCICNGNGTLCALFCSCSCSVYHYKLAIEYNCDNNYNCSSEVSQWFSKAVGDGLPSSINVGAKLNFSFQRGQYYRIKLTTHGNNECNGNYRTGVKNVYISPDLNVCPNICSNDNIILNNVVPPGAIFRQSIIASNSIQTIGPTNLSGNKYWSAGNFIQFNSGFITMPGANFVAELAPCTNSSAPSGDDQTTVYNSSKKQGVVTTPVKYDKVKEGTNPIIKEISTFSVYPNPNNGSFSVYFNSNTEEKKLSIFNSLGHEIIYKLQIKEKVLDFDLRNFSKGFYWLRVIDGDIITTQKIILI
jgi:hypothetical protein